MEVNFFIFQNLLTWGYHGEAYEENATQLMVMLDTVGRIVGYRSYMAHDITSQYNRPLWDTYFVLLGICGCHSAEPRSQISDSPHHLWKF